MIACGAESPGESGPCGRQNGDWVEKKGLAVESSCMNVNSVIVLIGGEQRGRG